MYFDDEEGNKYTEAYFDGYQFGDRQLEGVIFRAFIVNDKLKVELADKDDGYFKTLNTKMWLKAALEFAMENDIFMETPDGGKELSLKPPFFSPIIPQSAGTWSPVIEDGKNIGDLSKYEARKILMDISVDGLVKDVKKKK